ncbi:helix-turn-helix domain-containing protein [Lacrimispora indolis]|jgi:transcriptional regulator with XRE-family HTH domain|uniref:helix-turn-helix domain-containing protein n=1 Tax=Lacrimispora indolis TaxID=69825 RepID=UPI0003FED845|nr:helix-turn-helix transcriptional regulator [[Clostridium] methoxybenzovorans]
MRFDDLFDNRNLVAAKLKDYIRDRGYTKVSFARKSDISRPTLDKLLNGSIDNKSTYDRHLHKIMAALGLSVDDLMLYNAASRNVDAVYSQNAPENYEMSEKAKKQYALLTDILGLCEIYY